MQEEVPPITRVPARIPDSFLIGLDRLMRRTGQGAHVSQSFLELDGAPDLDRLRDASRLLLRKHPLLVARLRRDWRTWLLYWAVPIPPDRGLPLGLWQETGSPGHLGTGSVTVGDGMEALHDVMNEPLARDGIPFNARLDVVERRDGTCIVALSWAHTLIDGKGAELLLADLGRLCDRIDLSCETREPARPVISFREKIQRVKGAVFRFSKLARLGVHSVSGAKARAGRCRYRLLTLSPEESAMVRARAERITGSLFPMPYYLACASRAHHAVFLSRGTAPEAYVSSVPVQMRRRGGRGPVFHNHMSILFFCAMAEEMGTLEELAAALKKQFGEMTRERLEESFFILLELMRRVPSWLFMTIVRAQFRGEISSFFHSHTGQFAPELETFAGTTVTNAQHRPCLGAPPGSGIFLAERGDRVNIAISWRDGCLSDNERQIMEDRLLEDLLGAPRSSSPADRDDVV